MKSSYSALGVVCLTLSGLWVAGGGARIPARPIDAAEQVRVSPPVTHENLTVYFIHGPDAVANAPLATLQEALDAGWAVIHETGDVNHLTVENKSQEYELFIQQGDIIRGGRQDRMIAQDMLLPPNSGTVSFPCHCVEQGRWTGRGTEAATHFSKSDQCAVGSDLKYANATGQQAEVWKSVAADQAKLSRATQAKVTSDASASSLQLTLESQAVKTGIADYEDALLLSAENRSGVIGVVFVVNGGVAGAEVYGSNALFRKAWPKLLRSAATEALAEKKDQPVTRVPTAREMERFLARAGEGEAQLQRALGEHESNLRQSQHELGRLEASLRELSANAPVNQPQGNARDVSRTIHLYRAPAEAQRIANQSSLQAMQPNGSATAGRRGRIVIEGTEPTTNQTASRNLELDLAAPSHDGNRLNINQVENAAGLVTESRDALRQNALIHKSFITTAGK